MSDTPWVEKYRPKKLSEIVGNENVIEAMQQIVRSGVMPNIIVSGKPGVGKTTSIMCIARELLGADGKTLKDAHTGARVSSRERFLQESRHNAEQYFSNNVLELNASDERGVSTVRETIARFAMQRASLNRQKTGRHKIVILDEADSLTDAAQQHLRRLMEQHSDSTRFALSCNDSRQLIDALQSRCVVLRFLELSDDAIESRLRNIAESENVPITDEGLDALVFTADGDLRAAINNLQSTYAAFGNVTDKTVFSVCDTPHPTMVEHLLSHTIQNQLVNAMNILMDLFRKGYSALDILQTMYRVGQKMDRKALGMDDEHYLMAMRCVGDAYMRSNKLNSKLQVSATIARLCDIGKIKRVEL